uniref:C3H1-type domain-containing protein n=1 Tax=Amphimedon queenslandica TaxID=400682 RepID=A0A1X7U1S3_AMPQE
MSQVAEIIKQKLTGATQQHIILVGDGKTYQHLQQSNRLYGDALKNILIFPADWHILKNFQQVLMKQYYHVGLKDIANKIHKVMPGKRGRPRGTPHRRSAQATSRAATTASAPTSSDGFPSGSAPASPVIPLQELHSLMSLISEQLRSHSSLASPVSSSGVTVPAPAVQAQTQNSLTTAVQTSSPLALVTSQTTAVSTLPPAATAFLPDPHPLAPTGITGGTGIPGTGILGGVPPPQSLASVPILHPGLGPLAVPAAPAVVGSGHGQPTMPARQAPGLVLSPDCQPIPGKLVEKVLSGQFVEMREFLADNVKLLDSLEATPGGNAGRPRVREVSSPLTWIHCFMAYAAIRCKDPFTRDMLAYARLILGEAMRHGGSGWLEYDRAARQQRAIDPTKPWNVLDPGLHSALVLSRGSAASVKRCSLCHGADHTASQCALASLEHTPSQPWTTPRRQSLVCVSWNRGTCSFPGTCSYRHVCSSCFGNHKVRDCTYTRSVPASGQGRKRQHSPVKP